LASTVALSITRSILVDCPALYTRSQENPGACYGLQTNHPRIKQTLQTVTANAQWLIFDTAPKAWITTHWTQSLWGIGSNHSISTMTTTNQ
jgi:hypothetical protein